MSAILLYIEKTVFKNKTADQFENQYYRIAKHFQLKQSIILTKKTYKTKNMYMFKLHSKLYFFIFKNSLNLNYIVLRTENGQVKKQ